MAGYSENSLTKKLGIKEGFHCLFIDTPDHYGDLLKDIPPVHLLDPDTCDKESADFIHFFVQFESDYQMKWDFLKTRLKKNGFLWISWPKASSSIAKDLNGNTVRAIGLEGGLVDVKVCAVDVDWSGLKFMYRKEDR